MVLFGLKDSPEVSIPFSDAVLLCQKKLGGMPAIGEGFFNPEDEGVLDIKALTERGVGNYSPAYSFGTHVTEAEVDPDTGQVEIRKITNAHDCGTPINPMAVEGQLQGSIVMGHAYTLGEEVRLDEGLMLNPNFLELQYAHVLRRVPDRDQTRRCPRPRRSLWCQRGRGRAHSATAPAIGNAIHHATGVWVTELPIDPERLLQEMERKVTSHSPDEEEKA